MKHLDHIEGCLTIKMIAEARNATAIFLLMKKAEAPAVVVHILIRNVLIKGSRIPWHPLSCELEILLLQIRTILR
jgi:hypothetical protein